MQNIKICPKCNQAATNGNNAFCPYDGTALVEMQPMQNQQWQQPPAIQSQVIPTPSPAPKKKMNPLMIGCLALIGLPIIIFAVMSVAFNSGKNTISETNVTSNSVQSPTPPSAQEKKNRPYLHKKYRPYLRQRNLDKG
jgi:hypothetical protein